MTTLHQAFAAKYPATANKVLSFFSEATGTDAEWTDITKPNIAQFVDYMQTKLAASSVRTYCAQLKSVLNVYSDELDLPKGWERMLSTKDEASEQVYLTDGELRNVIEYCPDTKIEAVVQQQFILSALVGARHGDIAKLDETNIRDGFVCYVSEKTHIKAQVPMASVTERILRGNFTHKAFIFRNEDFELFAYKTTVSDTTFNETLRRICMLCDIDKPITLYRRGKTTTAPKWKFIASHTGRRTCATLLYLHGCDIYTISRILAHSSVEMTARKYIMAPMKSLSDETMQYFRQFG